MYCAENAQLAAQSYGFSPPESRRSAGKLFFCWLRNVISQVALVQLHHTYILLINTRDLRGLFVFRVNDYQPNSRVN